MKRFLSALAVISASVLAQLPNGEPAGAIPISLGINPDAPAGTSGNTFTNVGEADALSVGLPTMCGSAPNSDVFYSFTAPNSAGYAFATCTPAGFTAGTHTDTILQVLDAGTLVALGCDDDGCTAPGLGSHIAVSLTAGSIVLVRMASWSGTADGSFYLSVTETLPNASNDDCVGAIPLAIGPNACTSVGASHSADASGTCTAITTSALDVWYSFTTASTCVATVTRTGTGANQLGLYSGACGALTSVACGATSVAALVAPGTYYVRAALTYTGQPIAVGAFTLDLQCVPPPANDDCSAADVLVEGVLVNGTTLGSTPSNPSPTCTNFTTSNPDVWYAYTPATSGTVRVTRSASLSRMAAYTGSCGALAAVTSACSTATNMVFDVVAGTQYFIRVGVAAAANTAAFQILIDPPTAPTTSSDTCLGAASVALGTSAGTTVGATASNPSPVCASFTTSNPDVWFQHTAAVSGVATLTPSSDGEGATRLAVYTTDCTTFTAVTGTNVCATITTSGTTAATWNAVAGTTYYFRFGVVSATTASPFLFNLNIVPFEPNDSCSGALPITNGVNGPYNNTGTLAGLDAGFQTTCVSASRDLFYTYTAPCDGNVTITTCGGNNVNEPGILIDSVLSAYSSWTCAGPNTAVACNDDTTGSLVCGPSARESTITFPVLAGTTYLVQVAGFSTTNVGTFNLTVTLATAQLATIGAGCGPGPVPTLSGSGLPQFGTTGTITVQAQAAAFGALLASPPNTAMVYAPFGPCTIYLLQPGMVFLLPIGTDLAGQWTLTTSFPAYDPALDCYGVDLQAFVIGAGGIEFTNALRLVIGT